MTVKLVMLKSGEDVIADVKEIKSNEEVIGYYFDNPLLVKMYESENEPTVLNEGSTTKEYASKVRITFSLGFLYQKILEYLVLLIGL